MNAADSIPRKIIEYLRAALPADIDDALTYDAVAQRGEAKPVCVVNACPSVPDTRAAGRVDTGTRSLVCYISILWDARGEGRNYDDFERAANEVVDAVSKMQQTTALGQRVIKSEIDPSDTLTQLDLDSMTYLAEIEANLTFIR